MGSFFKPGSTSLTFLTLFFPMSKSDSVPLTALHTSRTGSLLAREAPTSQGQNRTSELRY